MATITPTISDVSPQGDERTLLVVWTPVTNADTCTAIQLGDFRDRSVQIVGTFGSATVTAKGSNDGTNYVTLTDPQGNSISKTSAAIEQIEEVTRYFNMGFSGGDGTQSLSVYLFLGGKGRR